MFLALLTIPDPDWPSWATWLVSAGGRLRELDSSIANSGVPIASLINYLVCAVPMFRCSRCCCPGFAPSASGAATRTPRPRQCTGQPLSIDLPTAQVAPGTSGGTSPATDSTSGASKMLCAIRQQTFGRACIRIYHAGGWRASAARWYAHCF